MSKIEESFSCPQDQQIMPQAKFSKPDLNDGSQIMPQAKFSKPDFVTELYHLFHTYLLKKNVKDFDEIQALYQSAFTELLSKHKLKKLFTNVPRKGDLYEASFI